MARLSLQNVEKTFGAVRAVKAVNLDVEDGEFVVLVGPSGCGKSTLLRMIAGLEDISSGEIFLGGENLAGRAPRDRDMAMVFQDYALYPHMTVSENLGFALKMRRMPADQVRERIVEVATILELENLLDRRPRALSGGQRQRVALGRALIRDPELFLFDEPLSNLDAKLRVGMRMEIRKLQMALRSTSIYVTHDQVEAMTMADRIVVMRDGEVQQIGAPMEIYENPANRFVGTFIGSPPMSVLPADLHRDGGDVFLAFGIGLRIPLPPKRVAALRHAPVDRVDVGLRSEHVSLADDAADQSTNTFRSDIVLVEDHGADSIAVVTLCGQEIIARITPGAAAAGDKGRAFGINAGRVHLFHSDTGQNIG